VEKPRQVTVLLLIIMAVISLIEALFATQLSDANADSVSLTLYQMSSVFESGVSLACIVILHNWFKEEVLGTISAIWFSAIYLQLITQDLIYVNI
jgi:sugar phosphate permease